jgi:excisionase family DNA binding protein
MMEQEEVAPPTRRTLHPLMRTGEVAFLFKVDPSTVVRWAEQGKFRSTRTLGGQRRYLRAEIEELAAREGPMAF